MDVAKDMIREALPIKCLEAVILGMYPFLVNVSNDTIYPSQKIAVDL